MKKTSNITDNNREKLFKKIISKMTLKQIEQRSILVGMSQTSENNLFRELLAKEPNRRKEEQAIQERLEYYDSHCKESEIWIDPLTGARYLIDVDTTTFHNHSYRKFNNLNNRYIDTKY